MKTLYFAFFALLLTFLIWGCSKDDVVTPNPPTAYENASFSKGGMMYDKFWSSETGFNQNDTNIAKFNAKSDFFRCKQCHAWDYLGRNGSYIGRGPTANRPRVADVNLYDEAQSHTPEELFDAIKRSVDRRDISYDLNTYDPNNNYIEGDKMPNYGQLLTDAQIWDLVKYLKTAIFDVSQLYDATYNGVYPTGSASYSNIGKDGNPTNGSTYYSTNCASCHGPTGNVLIIEGMTLGQFTRSKPNEVQHKVKYGNIGTYMTGDFDITLSQMKDLYKSLSDTLAYPN